MWIILIIAFLIGIAIALLTNRGTEGFSVKEQVITLAENTTDKKKSETPATTVVLDEYGTRVNSGYYLVPYGEEKINNGFYKKYTVKPVPYGYKETEDKLAILPVTNVSQFSGGKLDALGNLPEWRELSYDEYSKLETKPIPSGGLRQGYFVVRTNTNNGPVFDKMAKIPINHTLLDSLINTNSEFLKWSGPVDMTTPAAKSVMTDVINVPEGYYQLKLIDKFIENDPARPEYVYRRARIPQGYAIDAGVPNKLGLVATATTELPDWRELTFAEYSGLVGKQGKDIPPSGRSSGHFIVTAAVSGMPTDKMVPIPLNHSLLNKGNKDNQFLMWSGPAEDIVGDPATAPVGDGYYRLKLVTSYTDDDPKKPNYTYKRRKIPDGYKLDPNVANQLGLVRNVNAGKYDATAGLKSTDAAYHETPSTDDAQVGTYYNFDSTGKLVEIEHKESNFAPVLYYVPGTYKYGTSNYVPNYEDSVYLSRITRDAMAQTAEALDKNPFGKVVNTSDKLGGFCNANKNNVQGIEEKCQALDKDACASTSCCVLLGGQKCVAGSERGPTLTANYSDYELINKDFYYYQGKCYGNC